MDDRRSLIGFFAMAFIMFCLGALWSSSVVTGFLQRDAVNNGVGEWVIIDEVRGITKFQWKTKGSNTNGSGKEESGK